MHAIRSPRRRQQAPPVRLAVEFALSGRVRSLSSPVGIDAVMRMHQLLARPAQLPEIEFLIKEAGGVGFAPVLSLLRELVERGERRPVILIVGNRIAEQIVFEDELLPREAPERWLYFVCGPTPMIDAVEETLERLDIPLEQIVSERFRYDSGRPGRRERRMLALFGVVAAANLLLAVAFALRG